MAFEILGSRVLAPFFGGSIFVWGSLISIFLAGLSVGYYGGGKAADIRPSSRMLGLIVLFPALWLLLFPFFQKAVLSWIFDADLGERLGPLLAALVLFFIHAAFLGAVSPYTVKMRLFNLQKTGETVGSLYALATIGSLVGTLMTSFYLITLAGVGLLISLQGLILLVLSIPLLVREGLTKGGGNDGRNDRSFTN
jgi:hypothetical protein